MKILKTFLFLFLTQTVFGQIDVQKEFELAARQYQGMIASHPDLTRFPQSSKPAKSEVDVPVVYADYYYLEALLRYRKITGQTE